MQPRVLAATLIATLTCASAHAQDQCRIGCACGEACIDCDDECHVDDPTGADPATNNGVVIAMLLVAGVVAVAGLAFAAATYLTGLPDAEQGPAQVPRPANPTGLNADGQRVMADCVDRLCGDDSACRTRMYEGVSAAPNKRDWLRDNGCIPDDDTPASPAELVPPNASS